MKEYSKTGLYILIALFFSIAHYINNQYLLGASITFYLIVVIFSKPKDFLPMLLFFIPWSTIMKITAGSYSFYTIGLLIMTVKMLLMKYKQAPNSMLYLFLLLLFSIIAKIIFHNEFLLNYFMFFANFVFVSLVVDKSKVMRNYEEYVVNYSFGIISACIAASMLMNLPHMISYINVYEWEARGLIRLSGFYGDPNFYSAQILSCITSNLIIIYKKGFSISNIVFVVLLIYFGLLSVSKSFILILVLILILWFIIYIINKKISISKIALLAVIFIMGLLTIRLGLFKHSLDMYLTRFRMANTLSALSTHRSDLFIGYVQYLYNNPIKLLLGQGYSSRSYVNNMGSHNSLIQSLFQFGIVGSTILLIWLNSIKRKALLTIDQTRINLTRDKNSFLLLLIKYLGFFGMWLSLDILFFDDFFVTILLFISMEMYLLRPNYSTDTV